MGREKKFYYLDSDIEKKNPLIYYAEHQPGYNTEYVRRRKQDPAWVLMKREYHRKYRELQKQKKIEEELEEMKKVKLQFPRTMIKAVSEPRTLSWC